MLSVEDDPPPSRAPRVLVRARHGRARRADAPRRGARRRAEPPAPGVPRHAAHATRLAHGETLQRTWRRAALVLSVVSTSHGALQVGIQHAAEAYASEPFDEVACQTLMRAHAAAGNRAEALRVFAGCRRLFREELGADPSEQTTQTLLGILRTRA